MNALTKFYQYINNEILALKHKIDIYKSYMVQKMDESDFHGVADAAMDIREFDARLRQLERLLKEAQDESSGEKSQGVCPE